MPTAMQPRVPSPREPAVGRAQRRHVVATSDTPTGRGRRALRLLLGLVLAAPGIALAQSGDGWERVGELGMMQLVIVDHERAAEEAIYDDAIATLCRPSATCFLRFYANPQGVAVTVPLPDAISHNTTAFYTLSTKASKQIFRWSCRVVNEPDNCY